MACYISDQRIEAITVKVSNRVTRAVLFTAVSLVAGVAMILRCGDAGDVKAVCRSIEGAAKGMTALAGFGIPTVDAGNKRVLAANMNPRTARFVVYYGDKLPPKAFEAYNVIVFDRDNHPPLQPLERPNRILLAYVSFGEAEKSRKDFAYLENQGLILDAGPEWGGNPIIDVRRPEWGDYLLNEMIPAIIRQGFDGVMLDTTDSLVALEKTNPARYAGLSQAAVELIKEIRERYPHLVIMLNRGFELLPQVEGDIDFELAESIYTDRTGRGTPALVPGATYRRYVSLIKKAEAEAPDLRVATIDYWPTDDKGMIRRIYDVQRAQGFMPYVTMPDLQSLTPEPE